MACLFSRNYGEEGYETDSINKQQKTTTELSPWNGQYLAAWGLKIAFTKPTSTSVFYCGSKHLISCSVRMLTI